MLQTIKYLVLWFMRHCCCCLGSSFYRLCGSWAHAVTLELSNESALSLQAASTETTVLQQRPAVLGVGLHCPESYLVTIAIYGHCQAASAETTVLQQRPAVLGVIPEWATLPGVIPGVYHHNNLSLSYHNIPPNKSQTKDNIKVSVLYGNFLLIKNLLC